MWASAIHKTHSKLCATGCHTQNYMFVCYVRSCSRLCRECDLTLSTGAIPSKQVAGKVYPKYSSPHLTKSNLL